MADNDRTGAPLTPRHTTFVEIMAGLHTSAELQRRADLAQRRLAQLAAGEKPADGHPIIITGKYRAGEYRNWPRRSQP